VLPRVTITFMEREVVLLTSISFWGKRMPSILTLSLRIDRIDMKSETRRLSYEFWFLTPAERSD